MKKKLRKSKASHDTKHIRYSYNVILFFFFPCFKIQFWTRHLTYKVDWTIAFCLKSILSRTRNQNWTLCLGLVARDIKFLIFQALGLNNGNIIVSIHFYFYKRKGSGGYSILI